MKDVVLIPCYRRAEFLQICLEKLAQNKELKHMAIVFHVDFGFSRSVIDVIERFNHSDKRVFYNQRHSFKNKLSPNLLRGYKKAAMIAKDYIFMIEEDVMVSNDFFKWHYLVQSQENLFCSIATKNNNRDVQVDNDLSSYYLSHLDYQSLGVCFNKSVIKNYVIQYDNNEYYKDLRGFVKKEFPNSKLPHQWCEQAGVIRRVQERSELPIAFPHIPRAFHAGFYGKNRGNAPSGNFAQRVHMINKIIFDKNEMRKAASNDRYYLDSMPVNLVNDINYKHIVRHPLEVQK